MADETAASETGAVPPTQIPSGMVKLRSSDGHLIPVERLILAAFSSVFRDMLEAISTDAEAEKDCPVSETHEELQILVKGLEGQADRTEADWLTLYKFMDNYDMQPLRVLLRLTVREMIDEDTLDAYCAAAILGDCEIQEIAARVVVQKQVNLRFVKHKIWEATPEQERLRLKEWIIAGWQKIGEEKEYLRLPRCKVSRDNIRYLSRWEEAVYELIQWQSTDVSPPP
ncbi:hypothetical protein B0A53_02599 [Rhodotorula sp. CCFEE 5036]|nr:hypothetical protein B0A53_02599 [Rhodotorula sp. CCFEE 5036]